MADLVASLDRVLVDGDLTVRPFDVSDRQALLSGRDDEFHRFLGQCSAEPRPVACICLRGDVVGWIDYDHDDDRHWLETDQVNVGYNVFEAHRGNGYATRAVELLAAHLAILDPPLRPTLLIDPDNVASLAVAERAGFVETAQVDGERFFTQPDSGRTDAVG